MKMENFYLKENMIKGNLVEIGKEYYENGKLKYEGEFKEGKKNGKGKEYDELGNLIFEGEYLDDNPLLKK